MNDEMKRAMIQKRQRLERMIARRLITDALAAGYRIAVEPQDDDVSPVLFSKVKPILNAMFTVDDERLYFYRDGPRQVGWARFIYGEDGWDVIQDYTVNLEPVMSGVNKIVERYAG